MTPQELRSSILFLAFQGKLTKQYHMDTPIDELIQACQKDKSNAIAQGKYRNEKFRGSIESDDYDIPDSWRIMYISDMSLFQEGPGILAVDFRTNGIPLIRIAGMKNEKLSLEGCNYLDPKMVNEKWNHFRLDLGDILISTSASMDKVCEVYEDCVGAIPYTGQIRFKMYGGIDKEYFKWYIQSPFYIRQINEQKAGAAIKHYGPTHLKRMTIPLAPIEEQKRIVAKIEELLPYIDRYEQAWTKLEAFNKRFPDDMQKSVLQMAIQGKLVEQLPEEGTAEELYKLIQTEKQKLIAEGKIKKGKPLLEISDDEIPFDIPESWKWVRLSEIAIFENGDRSKKYPVESDYVNFGIPFFGAKDICGKYLSFENVRYISREKYDELGNGKLSDMDFVCLLRGSVGKCAIFQANEKHKTGFICAQMVIIRCLIKCLCEYVFCFLSTPLYAKNIESKVTGTAVRQLPAKELGQLLIPLPPLAEQKRIVQKLEQILPLCERKNKYIL